MCMGRLLFPLESKDAFELAVKLFKRKWKEQLFVNNMDLEWFGDKNGWYEGFANNCTSTNNSLETNFSPARGKGSRLHLRIAQLQVAEAPTTRATLRLLQNQQLLRNETLVTPLKTHSSLHDVTTAFRLSCNAARATVVAPKPALQASTITVQKQQLSAPKLYKSTRAQRCA